MADDTPTNMVFLFMRPFYDFSTHTLAIYLSNLIRFDFSPIREKARIGGPDGFKEEFAVKQ